MDGIVIEWEKQFTYSVTNDAKASHFPNDRFLMHFKENTTIY